MTQRRNDDLEGQRGSSPPPSLSERTTRQHLDTETAATLEAIYKEFAANAFAYLRSNDVDPHLTADLVQQTFEKIAHYLQKGNEIASPLPFVIKVARNALIDWRRRSDGRFIPTANTGEHEYDLETADEIDLAIMRYDQRQLLAALGQALTDLPTREGEIVRMHHIAELSIPQIAKVLNLAKGTVRYHLSMGRRRLKDFLDRCSDGGAEQ